MNVLQTASFRKAVKKLHANQKRDLDHVVEDIIAAPAIGTEKSGDLAGMRVHKFKMAKQLALLAYTYESKTVTLTLLTRASHENFYRDLKKK